MVMNLKLILIAHKQQKPIPNWAAEQGYPVTNYEQLDDAHGQLQSESLKQNRHAKCLCYIM